MLLFRVDQAISGVQVLNHIFFRCLVGKFYILQVFGGDIFSRCLVGIFFQVFGEHIFFQVFGGHISGAGNSGIRTEVCIFIMTILSSSNFYLKDKCWK